MPSGMASKVILDTNSLIYSLEHKSDLRNLLLNIPEVSGIVVPLCVLRELERMSNDVRYARGALTLASSFPSIEGQGPADDCLLEIASKNRFFILTNDRELISRAKEAGIRTLSFKRARIIDFT